MTFFGIINVFLSIFLYSMVGLSSPFEPFLGQYKVSKSNCKLNGKKTMATDIKKIRFSSIENTDNVRLKVDGDITHLETTLTNNEKNGSRFGGDDLTFAFWQQKSVEPEVLFFEKYLIKNKGSKFMLKIEQKITDKRQGPENSSLSSLCVLELKKNKK